MNKGIICEMMQMLSKNKFLVITLLWILLWILPWTIWLDPLPWVRLGISIIIFVIPGMSTSFLLAGKRFTLSSHFISGLAFSVFFVGLLGLLGRIFQLPFAFIKPIFALAGLVLLLILNKHYHSESHIYKQKKFSTVTLILLFLMITFSITISFLSHFFSDDFSYLAYLTQWQHAQPLNFQEIIFNTKGIDSIRFWLAMFPMNLAFLSEISNLHGLLLIGFYIEPYLVSIAIIAIYNLYEDFLQSEYLTIAALLLQFTFLILRVAMYPGIIFFNHLSQDKAFAAIILAPAFFLAIRYFLESFNLRSAIFALLTGLSLTLTHPVILAFSVFIMGIYASIITIPNKEFKKMAVIGTLLVFIILPGASARIIEIPSVSQLIPPLKTLQKKGVFDLESALGTKLIDQRISYIKGTPFYNFNLTLIQIRTNLQGKRKSLGDFFSWSYLWILGLGFLWSLFNLKKNTIAPFIAAASLLVLLSAIPYTGWLVGYFVSARLLFRSSWMLPLGLMGVVLLSEFLKYISRKIPASIQLKISMEQVVFGLILLTSLISINYFSGLNIYSSQWNALEKIDNNRRKFENLAKLGDYLETNIQSASVFIAPSSVMNYLPGLSSKSKVVFFRIPEFSLYPVKIDEINLIFSTEKSISIEKRLEVLKTYHIQYIILPDDPTKNYYSKFPLLFDIQQAGYFWVLKFLDSKD